MFRGFYLAVLAVSIVASIAAGPCAAGTFTTDDIEYEMPEGWFKGEHQGARAYFTMMRMGTTIAEMFLTTNPMPEGGDLRKSFEEYVRSNSHRFYGFTPTYTGEFKAGGLDVLVQDFLHYSGGGPVQFAGRAACTTAGGSIYNFFFNTTAYYFPALDGEFDMILRSVRSTAQAAKDSETGTSSYEEEKEPEADTSSYVEVKEDVFLFNLGGEWSKAYDPEKDDMPKYNLAAKSGSGGLTSLLFFGRDNFLETNALFAIQKGKDLLKEILAKDIMVRETMGKYIPLGTTKRAIAGCKAIVHDLAIEKGEDVFFNRLCFVAVPAADNTQSRTYAPAIFHFVFLSHEKDSFNAAKPAMDALLDSMRLIEPLPEISPAPPFFDPRKGVVFRSPMDNFTVTLPEGAKEDKNPRLDPSDKGGESRTYTFKDAVILLSVFLSELDGEAAVTSLMDELEAVRKSASSWSVQGRKVPVSLYAAAEGQALVTALFERDNLLIAVLLPKDEYKEAQGWIKRLITGVTFD
ncbi:MAG: hypothetical protein QM441_06410 [Synergistota bacterium]|nr:hypothetical protein [Synergistota bacterium]OPZ40639.1 MAG: hypothetical protein BWY99_00576 [Synergistetes bacterium ADurb.BinA166]